MKLLFSIFVVFILNMSVRGAWWIPILQPVALSIGAVLTAVNIDIAPILDIQIFKNKEDKYKRDKTV